MPRGRSAPSARSDGSEMDTDCTAESEIAKLQRQLRIMEADRQAYNLQAREQIRKQQQEIDTLLREQEELHRNVGTCKNLSHLQQDSEDTQSLRTLLEQGDRLEEALRREKQSQKEIEKEITNMQSKLASLRKGEVSAIDSQRSEENRTQKAINTLEYKLDRALTHFSEQLTKNSELRKELQTLHIERVRFQQLQKRLEKELHDVRKKIRGIINLSNAAYDARVDAQSKMTMMKEKVVKDLAQYNAEMKELERVLAHEFSLKEFMTTKCNEQTGQDVGNEAVSELKEQRMMDPEEKSLDALEDVFKRIQTVTGEDDLDMLVTRFIQIEDRNFTLFNFVNEQTNVTKTLRDQISQMQAETEQFRVAGLQQDEDHRSWLRDIDRQQKKTESQAEDYNNQASITSKILADVKTGVNSIFSKMECDCSGIEDTLGSSAGITENNIMSYLGLAEQKTNELLTVQAFLNSKDLEKDYNPKDLPIFLLGQNPELLHIDYDEEESPLTDEEEQPLSREELRRRIMKRVTVSSSDFSNADAKASKVGTLVDCRRRSFEDALM
uniref:ODAD1 central coiled coil region domain-containing protein n=1 Tax=Mola mola TaxID=94237 RepID=A0A3Q3WXD8_MOLML